MTIKIGMVTEYYFPLLGGMTEHVYNVSKRLASRGYKVKIVTSTLLGRNNNPLRDPAGTEILRVGYGVPLLVNGSIARIAMGVHLRREIRAMLDRERFDLLHIHSPTVFSLPVFTLVEASCPCIGTYHTYFDRSMLYTLLKGVLQRRAVDKLAGQIAVSRTCIDAMQRYFRLDPRIIPNGVDTEVFHPGVVPLEEFRDGKKNLLFMGRFDPRNGLGFMLEVFGTLRARRNDVRLIVVGDGPFAAYYHHRVPKGIRSDIHFAGSVWKDRPRYYAACDVFCSPVTKASFGVTLVESMAAGRPIVAVDNTGYREVLGPEEGITVSRGDVRGFADAVDKLLDDESLRRRMGESGRRKSLRYSWDRVAGEILDYYLEVLERRDRGAGRHGITVPAMNPSDRESIPV